MAVRSALSRPASNAGRFFWVILSEACASAKPTHMRSRRIPTRLHNRWPSRIFPPRPEVPQPAPDRIRRLLPSLRQRNPCPIQRNLPLNLHLNRSPHFQLHIVAPLQQSPGNARRSSRSRPNTRAVQAASGQSAANAAHRASVRAISRRVFNLFARVAILLDGSFLILHAFVVRARRVLDRSRQHHRVTAGIHHRREAHHNFRPPLHPPRSLHVRNLPLNISSRRHQNVLVHHKRKRRLRINGVALARILGGDGLLEQQWNSRSRRNHRSVALRRLRLSGTLIRRGSRLRRRWLLGRCLRSIRSLTESNSREKKKCTDPSHRRPPEALQRLLLRG